MGQGYRILVYTSVVVVFLTMIVMGALPKLLPDLQPAGNDPRAMWLVYGYPLWFMTVTGLLELAAGLLVLVPSTRFWGGLLAACIMIGAAITNLMAGLFTFIGINIVILVAAGLAVWASTRAGRPWPFR